MDFAPPASDAALSIDGVAEGGHGDISFNSAGAKTSGDISMASASGGDTSFAVVGADVAADVEADVEVDVEVVIGHLISAVEVVLHALDPRNTSRDMTVRRETFLVPPML